jgi:hypothetical protein
MGLLFPVDIRNESTSLVTAYQDLDRLIRLAASSQQLQAEAKWSCPNAREWLL